MLEGIILCTSFCHVEQLSQYEKIGVSFTTPTAAAEIYLKTLTNLKAPASVPSSQRK